MNNLPKKRVHKKIIKLVASFTLIYLLAHSIVWLMLEIASGRSVLWPLLLLWAIFAYVVLPRVHRFFTKIYLPNYFIARTKTADGFFSDPVNIALNGPEKAIHKAMQAAGWTLADELNLKSSIKMVKSTALRKSYKHAPVSSLFLFSDRHKFAYQREIAGNPKKRHHIRFWPTPKGWWLPGGYKADWLAAATYDKNVGLSLYTGQITHKIASNTDEERDYVISTLERAGVVKKKVVVKHFTSAFRSRNGGGDRFETDGSLPFVDV